MHLSALSFRRLSRLLVVAGIVAVASCSGSSAPTPAAGSGGRIATGTGGVAGGSGGAAGGSAAMTGTGGSPTGSGGSVSGSGGAAGGRGGAGMGGSGGAVSGSGGASGAGGSGSGGAPVVDSGIDSGVGDLMSLPDGASSGWGGIPGIEDFTVVKPTAGCGTAPGQTLGEWVQQMVTVTPKPVRGSETRTYWIKLPSNYDNKKSYKVIFIGPGCAGTGRGLYDFATASGTEGVIQIGLNPQPTIQQNCFDDNHADSIEYQFFETLLDIAAKKYCVDEHRVFFTGHSSGSWVANMFGCVYGMKKLRAVGPSSGGLATGANAMPPCTNLPTPGIWHHNEDDTGNPPSGSVTAINRALKVNKCTGTFADSPRAGWMGDPVCEQFTTCPKEFPIVYCHPKTGGHTGNLGPQPARMWKFFTSLP